MTILFILALGLCLGFEIQKLFQFNYFFRLLYLVADYQKKLLKNKKSVVYIDLIKISLVEFAYSIVIFIGLFTENYYFFYGLIIISILTNIIFKYIKNNKIRKIYYLLNIFLSILCLSLPIINILFFHLTSAEFIALLTNIKL
jgi:hypothetical protein